MMRRAAAALIFVACAAWADSASEVVEVVATMANALSNGNASPFEKALSGKMASRDRILDQVRAMIELSDVTTTVVPLDNDGDDARRTLRLDWDLRMNVKNDAIHMVERHQAVTLTFEREGKKWKVTAISPETFFAPPVAP